MYLNNQTDVGESSRKLYIGGKKERKKGKKRKTTFVSPINRLALVVLVVPFSLCPSDFAHFSEYAGHHC